MQRIRDRRGEAGFAAFLTRMRSSRTTDHVWAASAPTLDEAAPAPHDWAVMARKENTHVD
jgi:hypothetical protein